MNVARATVIAALTLVALAEDIVDLAERTELRDRRYDGMQIRVWDEGIAVMVARLRAAGVIA